MIQRHWNRWIHKVDAPQHMRKPQEEVASVAVVHDGRALFDSLLMRVVMASPDEDSVGPILEAIGRDVGADRCFAYRFWEPGIPIRGGQNPPSISNSQSLQGVSHQQNQVYFRKRRFYKCLIYFQPLACERGDYIDRNRRA